MNNEKLSQDKTDPPLLEATALVRHYPLPRKKLFAAAEKVRAVDGVSLVIRHGETLGLVGESGCGKSTLGRMILRLEPFDRGSLFYKGEDVTFLQGERLRQWRQKVQVVFQEPSAALNPRMKAGNIIAEPLLNYHRGNRRQQLERAGELLETVGLEKRHLNRYPHEFSGGQCQRIGIARALALRPELIVLDEAVASLDVSIQSQILNLLQDLKDKFALSYLFISHDLSVVCHISDRVAVMYAGKIVEELPATHLAKKAVHPYTLSLLAAVPLPDPSVRFGQKPAVRGEPPDPVAPPPGCRFHPRCSAALEICRQVEPGFTWLEREHKAACHLLQVAP